MIPLGKHPKTFIPCCAILTDIGNLWSKIQVHPRVASCSMEVDLSRLAAYMASVLLAQSRWVSSLLCSPLLSHFPCSPLHFLHSLFLPLWGPVLLCFCERKRQLRGSSHSACHSSARPGSRELLRVGVQEAGQAMCQQQVAVG